MSNNDASFYTVRFDAISRTLQYAVGSNWADVPMTPPGSAIWGDITGTLSDQTDLEAALNAKAPVASPTFITGITTPAITGNGTPTIIKPSVDAASGTSSIKFTAANGTTIVMGIETANGRIGIGTATPNKLLTVNGDGTFAGTVNAGSGLLLPSFSDAVIATLPKTAGYSVYSSDHLQLQVANGSAFVPVGLVSGVTSVSSQVPETFTGNTGVFQPSATNTVTITPKSTSSRFLIAIDGTFAGEGPTNYSQVCIMRGASFVQGTTVSSNDSLSVNTNFAISVVDAPSTVSPVTYSIGMVADTGHSGTLAADWANITVTELAS